jgi:hypothetical protein
MFKMLSRQLVFASLLLVPGLGLASQRTFVSSTGNDGNPCSLVLPCRSLAAAIVNTAANGELIVLDSAGYGPVTVNQSLSIVAPPGIYGGVSVLSGNGVTIDGPGIAVVLRGLTVNGQGGLHGIHFAQGSRLTVEDCTVANMSGHGIFATAPSSIVFVKRTVIRGNVNMGVFVQGSVVANLDGLHVEDNQQTGVIASDGARITLSNSVLSKNFVGVHAASLSSTHSVMTVSHTVISGSLDAVDVTADGGSTAVVTTDALVIDDIATTAFGFFLPGGTGIIYTAGNNIIGPGITVATGGSLTPIAAH